MKEFSIDDDFSNAPLPGGDFSAPETPAQQGVSQAAEAGAHMVDYRANAFLRTEQDRKSVV